MNNSNLFIALNDLMDKLKLFINLMNTKKRLEIKNNHTKTYVLSTSYPHFVDKIMLIINVNTLMWKKLKKLF